MSDSDIQRVVRLLEEIRDHQKAQLDAFLVQSERAARLQDRAEELQARSAQLVGRSRRVLMMLLPVIIVLIAYVSWLIFRLTVR
ncbi:MAG TPA: hypothetical protein VM140_11525 [Burkholderiales bacterium]|nr:hypothetical protein [Burkholderiales bacterium]